MKVKNKKISLAVCSLLAMATIVGGAYSVSNVQNVVAESNVAEYIATDTETKSDWEAAGYGTDGYIILGSNPDKAKLGYSNLYTQYGNDGETEITWYRHGNSEIYYEEYEKGVDSTAPIGKWAWLGQTWSRFTSYSGRNSYLYAPGTTTEFPGRLHNTNESPNRDTGFSFELRDVGSIYASVYVTDAQSEWNKVDYTANPITVSVYKTNSLFVTTANDSNKAENVTRLVDEYYGEAVAETTVTTNNVYVTFALNEPSVYTIVAYYKNSDKTANSYILPSTMGLFFDKDGFEEEEIITPTIEVSTDTETKSAWESAGYGTDGYIILGSNSSKQKLGYSNLYTQYGNDGKEEITWYRHGNSEIYYGEEGNGVDATAPIGKWAWLGQTWSYFNTTGTFSGRNSYLYVPGTTTEYGWRLHNTNDSPNKDTGFSFELRDVGSINATVYVTDAQSEWKKVDYTVNPITVSLYKTNSLFQTTANDSNKAENVKRALEDYYGTPIAETTVTTNNVYVTFALNEPGVYTIVAYYKNSDKAVSSPIVPSTMGLFFDEPEPALAEITTSDVVDNTSKSAWEANGYGTDGYIILGANSSNEKTCYSNMYTEQNNDGKTEIKLYYDGQKSLYYDSNLTKTDSTAPISGLVVNDGNSVTWKNTADKISHWGANQPDLYIPGTETTYPVRIYNGITDPYHDKGIGFTLRETEKIYVTVYVLDWAKKVSDTSPITVGLFSGIKNTTFTGYSNKAATLEEHYGTPLKKTTVTSQGAYVTFAIEGAGQYQIVAYYDNEGTGNAPVTPMITGLFFDKEIYPEVTSTSLSLEGDIGVNYYVGARGQDLTGGYLQVKYANGNIQQVPVPDRYTDGTYKFQVKIAAKDYAVKMKVRLFDKDGNAISKAFTYSAENYVKTILSAGASVYGEKLIALATALDDYGKAVKNLFYGERNTFTTDLSAVTTSSLSAHKFSVSGSLPVGVKLSDFSLSLKATTSLKIYFTAESLEGVVCKVGDTVVTPEATGVANEYCIVIENINAKDLDTNYVVSFGGYQLTLSALSYSLRALEYSSNANLKTAMQALYLYNQAANTYFEEV